MSGNKLSSINEELLTFVAVKSLELVTSNSDGVEQCYKDLLPVWQQVREAVGYYGKSSFILWNEQLKKEFTDSERFMLALERLYPPLETSG